MEVPSSAAATNGPLVAAALLGFSIGRFKRFGTHAHTLPEEGCAAVTICAQLTVAQPLPPGYSVLVALHSTDLSIPQRHL